MNQLINNFIFKKTKKYIVSYEELDNKIKVINNIGEYKLVDNNVSNKIKIMETIKNHKREIENKIDKYDKSKDDNIIVLLSSGLIIIFLGCLFGLSFFLGSYIMFFTTFISFAIALYLFSINTYNIFIKREEVRRLKLVLNNNNITENELLEFIKDIIIIIKNKFYGIILKIISLYEDIKVKNN